jgi:hypothetical protein
LTLSLFHSHKFSFNPIHLKQFGALHFTLYVFSQPIISFHFYWYDSIASNTKSLIRFRTRSSSPASSYDFVLDHCLRPLRYKFVFHHPHRLLPIIDHYLPIRTLGFVYLYPTKSTNSYTWVCISVSYQVIHPNLYTNITVVYQFVCTTSSIKT